MASYNLSNFVSFRIQQINDEILKNKNLIEQNFPKNLKLKELFDWVDFKEIEVLKKLDNEMNSDKEKNTLVNIKRELTALKIFCDDFYSKIQIIKDKFKVFTKNLLNEFDKNNFDQFKQSINKNFDKLKSNGDFFDKLKYNKFRENLLKKFMDIYCDVNYVITNFSDLKHSDQELIDIKNKLEENSNEIETFRNFVKNTLKINELILTLYISTLNLITKGYFFKLKIKYEDKINKSKKIKEKITISKTDSYLTNIKEWKLNLNEAKIWGKTNFPRPSHVRQGYIGDCFLLSALQTLAYSKPYILKDALTIDIKNKRIILHVYKVKKYKDGVEAVQKVDIILNRLILLGITKDNFNKPLWPFIYESGYMISIDKKIVPVTGEQIIATELTGDSLKLIYGGYTQIPLTWLTGKSYKSISENLKLKEIISSEKYVKNLKGVSFSKDLEVPRNLWYPWNDKKKKALIHLTKLKIHKNHAYSFFGIVKYKQKLWCIIRNPHGFNKKTGFWSLFSSKSKGKFIIESEYLIENCSWYIYKNKKEENEV